MKQFVKYLLSLAVVLLSALTIVLFGITAISCTSRASSKDRNGWERGYLINESGSEDKNYPCVSKAFSTEKGNIVISFTRNGFILDGDWLPSELSRVQMNDSKTGLIYSSELTKNPDGRFEADFSKVRTTLINSLECEESLLSVIELTGIFNGLKRTISVFINPKGGKGLEEAISTHINGIANEVESNLEPSSCMERVAYSIGVKYITDPQITESLREYLRNELEAITGASKYDNQLERFARKGYIDAFNDKLMFSKSYCERLLTLAECEGSILKNEISIRNERDPRLTERFHISMNCNYRDLDKLIKENSDINYWPDRIVNYAHKRDSIFSLPPDKFKTSSTADSSQEEPMVASKPSIGNWTLKDGQYESPVIKEIDGKGCTVQFVLRKGNIIAKFNRVIEAEYDINILSSGNEHTIKGVRKGRTFTISSSAEIPIILSAMDRGNFTFQYMFLENGSSHYGWFDFKIGPQLKSASEAYKSLN